MKYIADLHIHSPFSRATSKASNLIGLAAWARIKGIHVLGTGDFTHPGWFRLLKEQLAAAEPGFYKLREHLHPDIAEVLTSLNIEQKHFASEAAESRFVLTAEISSIYKRGGKVRKVHNILFVPDFASAEKINVRLAAIGNIESDGRPILGLDSHDLLEILLEHAPGGFLVPAHIWTPWFSLFGSKSGFDAIEDCFEDLTDHVFALETGLSSDPDMNRCVSALDRFTLISNSDCHSPSKLGREANIFQTDFSFSGMRAALEKNNKESFLGTIEFYPEEGKYHYDGHRKCNICFAPIESKKNNDICPVCLRPLTIGVTHRIMELADRPEPVYQETTPDFYSLIPLPEVLGEILGRGPNTKGVMAQYARLVSMFGSEFALLFDTPIDEIEERYSSVLAEAVSRIRTGQVIRNPGYDGEFGVIKVFSEEELHTLGGQAALFSANKTKKKKNNPQPTTLDLFSSLPKEKGKSTKTNFILNSEQLKAVESQAHHIIVTAGPGTGKTHTLVARLRRLMDTGKANPGAIAVITFTNRAADEVKERLLPPTDIADEQVFVGTFHGFCLQLLRLENPDLTVVGEDVRRQILKQLYPGLSPLEEKELQQEISNYFATLNSTMPASNEGPAAGTLTQYLAQLRTHACLDLEEIIPFFTTKLTSSPASFQKVTDRLRYLFVDEFQDVNAAQYELVKTLARHVQIFAIGDPDQAIYGFRGSNPDFFFRFIREFSPEAIALTRNYRSTPTIIKAASAVINHNPSAVRKSVKAEYEEESVVEYFRGASPEEEAEFIVSRIEQSLGGISHFSINSGRGGESGSSDVLSFSDIAVLYRLSQQAAALCKALERRGIPFQIVDIKPYFMQPQIRAVYYWIQVADGCGDISEHLALLRHIKGVGASTIRQLETELLFSAATFFDAVFALDLPAKLKGIVNEIKVFIGLFVSKVERAGLSTALLEVFDWLQIDPDLPEAERLLELAGSFGKDLSGFSGYLKRNSQATVYDEKAESVSLMTMHAAKGLEFPMVFITGADDGILPCTLLPGAGRERGVEQNLIAEERRLFYVALTRAQKRLVLSSAKKRSIFGETKQLQPSRFLKEIPSDLIEMVTPGIRKKKKKPSAIQMRLF